MKKKCIKIIITQKDNHRKIESKQMQAITLQNMAESVQKDMYEIKSNIY